MLEMNKVRYASVFLSRIGRIHLQRKEKQKWGDPEKGKKIKKETNGYGRGWG
jgi:hypothetical protein